MRPAVTLLALAALLFASTAPQARGAEPPLPDDRAIAGSVHASELLAHPDDASRFTPGAQPSVALRPRAAASGALSPASGSLSAASASAATTTALAAATAGPTREVFGYLPYWTLGGANTRLDYSLLSTIAYFGIAVDGGGRIVKSVNGAAEVGWAGWTSAAMTRVIDGAHASGVRVVLGVHSFGWSSADAATQRALLTSPTARTTFAQQIAAAVVDRRADGVNLDFEPIVSGCSGGACYSQFLALVRTVRAELNRRSPGLELTIANTAWLDPAYPIESLTAAGAADAVFVMGYDYRLAGSATAGAVAPLAGSGYDLTETVLAYTKRVGAGKVILGLPYYGRAWSTSSTALNATVTGSCASAVAYYYDAIDFAQAHGRRYDATGASAWTVYSKSGCSGYRQLYYDDAQSLAAKYDLVNRYALRGTGMWALGFDGTSPDLWGAIRAKFGAASSTGTTSTFVPVSPFRLVDSRIGRGLGGAVKAGVPARLQVARTASVPAGAVAVTGNLTTTGSTAAGFLALSPAPPPNPAAPATSTLNFPRGEDRANGVTMPLGPNGELYVTYGAAAGSTSHVVLDVTGYYVATDDGVALHPVAPARLVDTRFGAGIAGALLPGRAATFAVRGKGGLPATATAVTGNLTVAGASGRGYLYLGPAIPSSIPASTLNFPARDTRANNVTVPLAADGSLAVVYQGTAGSAAPVIFDVTGYFDASAGGAVFVPLVPSRVVDTRTVAGARIASGTSRSFPVGGRATVPVGAVAVAANVTVTGQTAAGYVAITPNGGAGTSTVNFPRGETRANGAVAKLGAGGSLSAYYLGTAGSSTDLILDVTGYFVVP